MWTRRTKSRPDALIHHSTAHMRKSTSQHCAVWWAQRTSHHITALHHAERSAQCTAQHSTALRCVTRCALCAQQTHADKLVFHWPEAVCLFLHVQAAFLPARPKPNDALLPLDYTASLVTYEFKCAVFPRKQASNSRSQSVNPQNFT